MNLIEYQAAYPEIEDAEPPEPGVIVPNFGQGLKVVNGEVVGGPQDDKDRETALELQNEILERHKHWKRRHFQDTEI